MTTELAPGKVNLVLHVGARREDGLHELCSLFASLELADRVEVEAIPGATADAVVCPGVEGPNLADTALAAYRATNPHGAPPALSVRIEKRVPVAAGLGGGSADAAAVLRTADARASKPLGLAALRRLGARVGADVPSQVEPGHALVTGAGERVEPLTLPPMTLVLAPQEAGLSTAQVYAEADRLGSTRTRLDPERLRELSGLRTLEELAAACENDLEAAALSLRPELGMLIQRLRDAGAAASFVTGSGPTVVGAFSDPEAASRAAGDIRGAILTGLRERPRDSGASGGDSAVGRAPSSSHHGGGGLASAPHS